MLPHSARLLLLIGGAYGDWAQTYNFGSQTLLGSAVAADENFQVVGAAAKIIQHRATFYLAGERDANRNFEAGGDFGDLQGRSEFWYSGPEAHAYNINVQMSGDGTCIFQTNSYESPTTSGSHRDAGYFSAVVNQWVASMGSKSYRGGGPLGSGAKITMCDSEARIAFKIEHSCGFVCFACPRSPPHLPGGAHFTGSSTGIGKCLYPGGFEGTIYNSPPTSTYPEGVRRFHSRDNIESNYANPIEFETSGTTPTSLDMTKDGSMIVVGGDSQGVDIFNRSLADGTITKIQTIQFQTYPAGAIAGETVKFSDDGSRLVVSCMACSVGQGPDYSGEIFTFKWKESDQQFEFANSFRGEANSKLGAPGYQHGGDPGFNGMDLDGEGNMLCTTEATPNMNGKVKTWEWSGDAWLEATVMDGTENSNVSKCFLSKDGKRLITAAPLIGEVTVFEDDSTTTETVTTETVTATTATGTSETVTVTTNTATGTETTTTTTTWALFVDSAHRVHSSVVVAICGIMYTISM